MYRHIRITVYTIVTTMEILQSFVFSETPYEVRTYNENGKILFRAEDVGNILELKNVRSSVADFDGDEKGVHSVYTSRGFQNVLFLSEEGVYRLLFQSRKPIARPFQKWVASVIRQIREEGEYKLSNELSKMADENARLKSSYDYIAAKSKLDVERASHQALVQAYGDGKSLVYFGKIREEDDGHMLVKVGSTMNLKVRAEQLAQEFGSMVITNVFEVCMHVHFEKMLQHHQMLKPYAYRDPICNGRCSNGEVFKMTPRDFQRAIDVATRNAYKFQRFPVYEEHVNIQLNINETQEAGPSSTASPTIMVVDPSLERKYTQARGDKVQRYTPDGKVLIKTYVGHTEATRDPDLPSPSANQMKIAIKNRYVYKGFRWAELDRELPDDTVQDIGETVESTQANKGLVAMLNLDKSEIVKVFCDMKDAATDRKFKGVSAISKAVRQGTQSGGHYFVMWHECSDDLKQAYLLHKQLPCLRTHVNGKMVIQLNVVSGEEVARFSSVSDVMRSMRVARQSLYHAIDSGIILKGFLWKYSA